MMENYPDEKTFLQRIAFRRILWILGFFLASGSICCYGQVAAESGSQVYYSYDASGNRTARTIYDPSVSQAAPVSKSNKEAGEGKSKIIPEANLADLETKVSIHPNPVQGLLTVEISNDVDFSQTTIRLTDGKGGTIVSRKPQSAGTVIDLSAYPDGLYIIRIQIGENTITRKIIKG